MTHMIGVYTSATSATPAPVAGPSQEVQEQFAWMAVSVSADRPELHIPEELAAEIREALAAADRGETEDLGSFAQYADEPDDED